MRASLRRILAIGSKEFIHIRRDPRILILVLVVPLVELLLFAYAISFNVTDVPTVVLDGDKTQTSREFITNFEASDFFKVTSHIDSLSDIDDAFVASEAGVAVVVKPGFSRALDRGEQGQVAVFIDGSSPNTAQFAQAYSTALTNKLGAEVTVEYMQRSGVDPTQAGGIDSYLRTWYNPERRSADFLVPGLIVVIIMIVTVQQTAVTLVREREQGTFEQLTVSPMRRGELMLGKITPWVAIGVIDMIAIAALGVWLFDVPMRGDVFTFLLAIFLFVLCCLAIGLIVSARASSLESANIAALLIAFLPAFMLSNFVFPLYSLPAVLQWISYLFPARYMVAIARSVMLKGAGMEVLWPQVLALGVYAAVSLTIATLMYARRA